MKPEDLIGKVTLIDSEQFDVLHSLIYQEHEALILSYVGRYSKTKEYVFVASSEHIKNDMFLLFLKQLDDRIEDENWSFAWFDSLKTYQKDIKR